MLKRTLIVLIVYRCLMASVECSFIFGNVFTSPTIVRKSASPANSTESVWTADGSDFKNINDFLLPNGDFNLDKYSLKVLNRFSFSDYAKSKNMTNKDAESDLHVFLLEKNSYAEVVASFVHKSRRPCDIVDALHSLVEYTDEHDESEIKFRNINVTVWLGRYMTNPEIIELALRLDKAYDANNTELYLDLYMTLMNKNSNLDRSTLLTFLRTESRLKQIAGRINKPRERFLLNANNTVKYRTEIMPLVLKLVKENPILRLKYLMSEEELDLAERNITRLDESLGYMKSLKKLDLTCNEFVSVEANGFSFLPNLISLVLDSNQMVLIRDEAFHNLTNLVMLSLIDNDIFALRKYAFNGLTNLKFLFLNKNHIKQIDSESFFNLNKLVFLDLNSNRLSSIKFAFSSGNRLEELDLDLNEITELKAKSFKSLKNLRSLSISSNGMRKIEPEAFSELSQLVSLDLNANELAQIEANALKGLKHLKKLNLNDNQLRLVELKCLSELKHLELKRNPLGRDAQSLYSLMKELQSINPKIEIKI